VRRDQVSGELVSVKEVVDLSAHDALDEALSFLTRLGYRTTHGYRPHHYHRHGPLAFQFRGADEAPIAHYLILKHIV
jgi:hypothetical protein